MADGARLRFRRQLLLRARVQGAYVRAANHHGRRLTAEIRREHAGVGADHRPVEAALHAGASRRRVTDHDAVDAKPVEGSIEPRALDCGAARGRAAVPIDRVVAEYRRACQGFHALGRAADPLCCRHAARRHEAGRKTRVLAKRVLRVQGARGHEHVHRREVVAKRGGVFAVDLGRRSAGNRSRQPAVHERRLADGCKHRPLEQPGAEAAVRREQCSVTKETRRVAGRELRRERGVIALRRRTKALPRGFALLLRLVGTVGCVLFGRYIPKVADQIHGFVVAEHELRVAAGLRGLLTQTHQQLEGQARFATAVEHVAEHHEPCVAAAPIQRGVDEACGREQSGELRVRAMHVADGDDSRRIVGGVHGPPRGQGREKRRKCREFHWLAHFALRSPT